MVKDREKVLKIFVDNRPVEFGKDQPHLDAAGRLIIPVKELANVLGTVLINIENTDDSIPDKIAAVRNDRNLVFTDASFTCLVNGEIHSMDAQAIVNREELYIPAGFLIDKMGDSLCCDNQGSVYIFTDKSRSAIKIKGIGQYTISIADFEESIAWYTKYFGFTLKSFSANSGGQPDICCLQAPGFILEMINCPGAAALPEYRKVTNTDLSHHGHKHFSLAVKDGPGTVKRLKELGLTGFDIKLVDGTYGAFIQDNTGNLIEIAQTAISEYEAGNESGPVQIEGLNHTAVSVPDLTSSVKWYNEILGLKVCSYSQIIIPLGTLKVCRMDVPGGGILELFEFPGAEKISPDRVDPDTDVQTLGNKYFGVRAANIDKAAEDLKELGILSFTNNAGQMFIRDNAGNLIQLIE